MHEGTPGSGAGSNTFHLLGLLGSQGAHALQTGPQLTVSLSSAGGTLAIADGTDEFQFHPSQVGYDRDSTNTLAEVPGAGNSTPEATPSQLQGALAPGGAIARQQGGVAKAGPPSPGQRPVPMPGPLNSNRMVDEEGNEIPAPRSAHPSGAEIVYGLFADMLNQLWQANLTAQRYISLDPDVRPDVESFMDGVVKGDFSDDESAPATLGKLVGSNVPGISVAADARDLAAAAVDVGSNFKSLKAWAGLGLAALGFLPILGDMAKGGKKAVNGIDAAHDAAKGAIETAAKNPDEIATAGGKLAVEAEKAAQIAAETGTTGGKVAASSNFKWGNPKSKPTYGHTFLEHGKSVNPAQLADRARAKGTQIGQYLDDQAAADFIGGVAQRGPGVHDVPLPQGLPTRVVLPDGTEVTADMARIIVKPDGSVRTSYPFSSAHPSGNWRADLPKGLSR